MMHGVDEITFFYSLATLFQASFNPLFEPSYLQKQNRESVKITNEMVNFQGMNIICHAQGAGGLFNPNKKCHL